MKLSRNVSTTFDEEAKKKSATFARATATFGETLYGVCTLKCTPNHSELGTGVEQKRNSTIRTLKKNHVKESKCDWPCLDEVRYEIQIRYTR